MLKFHYIKHYIKQILKNLRKTTCRKNFITKFTTHANWEKFHSDKMVIVIRNSSMFCEDETVALSSA
jgi:hypothetical protein